MEYIPIILNWFSQNILQKPAFFVGLLVMLGYALLKKPYYAVFAGAVKATVGYMILDIAAGGLVTTFRPILAALNYKFSIGAAVIDPYFGLTAANDKIANNFPEFVGIATSALLVGFFCEYLFSSITQNHESQNVVYYWTYYGTTSCNNYGNDFTDSNIP